MLVLGIAGRIASGKSTVAKHLTQSHHAFLINADQVAHQLYQPGSQLLKDIQAVFGDRVLLPDGNLNRPILRDIVFSDNANRQRLNQIVWPVMKEKIRQAIKEVPTNFSFVILEAAVLLEARWFDLVDCVWYFECCLEDAKRHALGRESGVVEIEAQWRSMPGLSEAVALLQESGKRFEIFDSSGRSLESLLVEVDLAVSRI